MDVNDGADPPKAPRLLSSKSPKSLEGKDPYDDSDAAENGQATVTSSETLPQEPAEKDEQSDGPYVSRYFDPCNIPCELLN